LNDFDLVGLPCAVGGARIVGTSEMGNGISSCGAESKLGFGGVLIAESLSKGRPFRVCYV
jgi:hypothetical protein